MKEAKKLRDFISFFDNKKVGSKAKVKDIFEYLKTLGYKSNTHYESVKRWGAEYDFFSKVKEGKDTFIVLENTDFPVIEEKSKKKTTKKSKPKKVAKKKPSEKKVEKEEPSNLEELLDIIDDTEEEIAEENSIEEQWDDFMNGKL